MINIVSHYLRLNFLWSKTNPELKKMTVVVFSLTVLISIIMISNNNLVFLQSLAKRPTLHGIRIQTPITGEKISIGLNNLSISGRSVDNESSNCQVSVIVNDIKPYQKASAFGLNGADDYSRWKFTLSPDYTELKNGTNKITAKLECKDDLDALMFNTIKITGIHVHGSEQDKLSTNTIEYTSGAVNNESVEEQNIDKKEFNQTQQFVNHTISYDQNTALPQSNLTTSTLDSTLNAQNTYIDKKMVLAPSIKYLVILIPNEGHESTNQPKKQLPLINQPYVPQNTIIDKSTSIIWLNADVGHRHKISLNDSNSEKIFESGIFRYNTTSKPLRLNETGSYQYWESNVSKEVPDFVMSGVITVTSQDEGNATNASQNKEDIVGAYMVPAKLLDKYRSEFEDKGFTIDSTFTYKDLRGGQKGTGPEQILIVWKTHNIPLKKVIGDLEELTPTLPYN
jgi:hypothetical protein